MASKSNSSLLLLAAVLVSVFAAAAATDSSCYPGVGIPSDPIPNCRHYVEQATCGIETEGPPTMKFLRWSFLPKISNHVCCQELAAIPQQCRCEALRYFMGRKTRPDLGGLIDLPGCPREPQRDFVRILVTPEHCNLTTIHDAPYCL
ncbi:hypothetical protein ACQ4PT_007949 [Festuca glaucescens]